VSLALTSPTPGSAVNSATANLTWSAVPAADNYALWIGSTVGAYDLYFPYTPGTSLTVPLLPRAAGTVYVRLWAHVGGAWYFNDFTYITTLALAFTSPVPGSTLHAATQAMTWSSVTGSDNYAVWVGSTPVAYDLFSAYTTGTNITISGIPSAAGTVYVSLWVHVGGPGTATTSPISTPGTSLRRRLRLPSLLRPPRPAKQRRQPSPRHYFHVTAKHVVK